MTKSSSLDLQKVIQGIQKYSPFMAKKIVMSYLNFSSPFNGHLKANLKVWDYKKASVKIGLHRKVKNHLGSVHAGALFTLGETCAGLLLVKNFNPTQFRLILQSASVEYLKQARSGCEGMCLLDQEKLMKIKAALKLSRSFFVPMETQIKNPMGELLCVVKTKWQIKPWDQVKGPAA